MKSSPLSLKISEEYLKLVLQSVLFRAERLHVLHEQRTPEQSNEMLTLSGPITDIIQEALGTTQIVHPDVTDMKQAAAKKLKVYGWQGHRSECRDAHHQTREVVAAKSKAAAARAAGYERASQLWNLGETGNKQEIEIALAKPGTVFWRALDDRSDQRTYIEVVK